MGNEVCATYREAALKMSLLRDDEEWHRALSASFRESFTPLSQVFATILACSYPSDPVQLWNDHLEEFITDIPQRQRGREKA